MLVTIDGTNPFPQVDFDVEVVIDDRNSVFGQLNVDLHHVSSISSRFFERFDGVFAKHLTVLRVGTA